ncbi:hypothetical protein NEDG_02096 [Nematocida displodere]|uniref:Ricin B lectin domain-containing protein n=1 Tax=Nematocida displodere TaxID=1805483 RepID=A0A177EJQ1_9MICR|nr:hypothetical protein NEDG_02096 [Nematocida displodere]
MRNEAVRLILIVSALVCSVVGKRGSHGRHRGHHHRHHMASLLGKEEKSGIFISSYIGNHYISAKHGILKAVPKHENAVLFDVGIKSDKAKKDSPLSLFLWDKGVKHIVTYNSLGEGINVEIPVEENDETMSDATIFREVITHNAKNPVYEIVSVYRKNMCITPDPVIGDYHLQRCSNGGNDLQLFRLVTYSEAQAQEEKSRKHSPFNMKKFLGGSKIPTTSSVTASSNGPIFKD